MLVKVTEEELIVNRSQASLALEATRNRALPGAELRRPSTLLQKKPAAGPQTSLGRGLRFLRRKVAKLAAVSGFALMSQA
jgi:hypothetical protein